MKAFPISLKQLPFPLIEQRGRVIGNTELGISLHQLSCERIFSKSKHFITPILQTCSKQAYSDAKCKKGAAEHTKCPTNQCKNPKACGCFIYQTTEQENGAAHQKPIKEGASRPNSPTTLALSLKSVTNKANYSVATN